jgi:hypothetical protein
LVTALEEAAKRRARCAGALTCYQRAYASPSRRIVLTIAAIRIGATPFWVRIVDDETGRGVPLVELRALNAVAFWTDSNGIAAIDDPAFEGRSVAFFVHSDGYEFQGKLLDDTGKILNVRAGSHVQLQMRRVNIAERLYRITGADIYRDNVLAGIRPPIEYPLLNGGVTGQDTNIAAEYRGKIFWCWGDTFGTASLNFAASCATSEPPGGGLDPSIGVNLNYFVDSHGFSREMLPLERPGPPELVWIEGLFTVRDDRGAERLIAVYTRQPGLAPPSEWGVAAFDDALKQFHVLAQMPRLRGGHVASQNQVRVVVHGKAYWYLSPHLRVPDEWRAITDPKSYESYTCLEPGTRFDAKNPRLERGPSGELVWGWKPDSDPIDASEERDLIARGSMKAADAFFPLLDADSGIATGASPSSIAWNAYRKKWIMLGEKTGAVYYSESDDPVGPWRRAKKIVNHKAYNFYNVVLHPLFDQQGGQIVYFEGTYTSSFSDAKQDTPRYNYNQIMYRLRLDDPRLRTVGSLIP